MRRVKIVSQRFAGHVRTVALCALVFVTVAGLTSWVDSVVEAKTTAKLAPEGDRIELVTDRGGRIYKQSIPVYENGEGRYFSAGVGIEEREAKYPRFPLKFVLVAGQRAFLTGVTMTIRDSNGAIVLDVPSEHVTGPWLFIELPSGTYEVAAMDRSQTLIEKKVTVNELGTTIVHLRWPAQ